MKNYRHDVSIAIAIALISALAATASAATAQSNPATVTDNGTELVDIVVTAQRRSERLQDVPITVTALSGSDLNSAGIADTQSLVSVVPGLSFDKLGNAGLIFLRGVGSNAGSPNDEPSVAVYVDGVYIAAPNANLFTFNDVDRVEVLKGPQGTLFGRNATGGVIQIITRDPSKTPTADVNVGYANYQTTSGSLYASTGLSDTLAVDLAVLGENQGQGWGRDVTTNSEASRQKFVALRSKLLWTPSDSTEVRLAADYSNTQDTGAPYRQPLGVTGVDANPNFVGYYNTRANFPNSSDVNQEGASLRVDQDFGATRFVSITSYRHGNSLYTVDQDATGVPVVNATLTELNHNYTQELQLLAPTSSKINWVLGAFYYNAVAAYQPIQIAGLAAAPFEYENIFGTERTSSFSPYAQATAAIAPNTNLTVGLRYTVERQSDESRIDTEIGTILSPPEGHLSVNKPTWRVALDHKFTDTILAYVSYNRGIKSGGFGLVSPGAPDYQPEILDAYEIGLKTEVLDRRVRLNGSAFWYNYKDIQVQVNELGGAVTANAAAARIRGLDFDFEALAVAELVVTGGFEYLHTEYTNYDNAQIIPADPGAAIIGSVTGNQLTHAPKFTGNLGLKYKIPVAIGLITASTNLSSSSHYFWSPDNRLMQPPVTLLNAALDWKSVGDRYSARVWGRNLTDRQYYSAASEQAGLGDIAAPAAPRTYGVNFGVHF